MRKAIDLSSEYTWESAFQWSRWFARGWTLQELLAPRSVEFFSKEGKYYDASGYLQFAVVQVPDNGTQDRAWWWYYAQTTR
jgi:hypothetical protein